MLIWSSPRGAGLHAPAGILRRDEFDTATTAVAMLEGMRDEGDRLLAQARQEAAGLLEAAAAQAQALRDAAAADAEALLAQARADARRLAEQATAEASEEAARRWHAEFAALHASHGAAMAGMEKRLAAVVAMAVERMVLAEPRQALLQRAILTLRDTLGDARTARLRVHPDDADAARAALSAIGDDPDAPRVQVEADAGLAPGSSIFDADIGRLDTSLQVQLDGLRGALERAVRVAAEEPVTVAYASRVGEDDGHQGDNDNDNDNDEYQDEGRPARESDDA
ncbi:type III secretion system stator protein SctL [Paracidovorax citrulli]|uniref:type III secretion system stator protein SctL n=1 Tax=Paracidovorax citrulli TaxID=80869 RepID=UPI0008822325|nr:type III secretion system stator protein SctL [Paracidovorax citrulli]UEG45882.1 type III secretion system stator protein SctL [Paracidovorax citrulli]UMT86822.1 HrpE/YscL family type III secretion apparatus protein [Paracidovorax citrulli]WIY34337.1 type III secretion system stator protein SctL [Paracidovorax citrulli]SDL59607.1 type III secretion protein L [Paracidovorax citrulli]